MKIINAFVAWFKSWWMVFIIPGLTVIFLLWLFHNPNGAPTTISAPIQFCSSQYTGRSKTEDIAYQTCASIDSKGTCTVPITNWTTETRNEVRITCDWVEWQ